MTKMDMQLWTEFARGSQDARDSLLAEHLGLVHHVARQLSKSLVADADFDWQVDIEPSAQ